MFVQSEDEALRLFGDNYKRIEVLDPCSNITCRNKSQQEYSSNQER